MSTQAGSVRHTSALRACALSVIPAPPSVIPAPPRHSCAGRNPGELGGFENRADAGRPPAGPSARSVIPAPSPSFLHPPPSFLHPPPSFLRPLRHSCAPSVIRAQAGIHASRLASKTAPILDGLPQVRAPPPSFLHPPRHSWAPPPSFLRRQESRRAGWFREQRRCSTASRTSERPLRHSCAGRNPCENGADPGRPPAGPSAPSVIPRPLRHSCAGRNPGEPARFENGADPGRPPAGPRAPSVIPAQAGIQASRLGSRTAPILDGLP